MGGAPVDFERLFAAVPSALLLLDLDLTVVDVNPAYCALLGRRRADLLGRSAFELFPENPDDPDADGAKAVRASFEAARDTGQVQAMPLQRYDVAVTVGGPYVPRYWSIVNAPIVDEGGKTVLLLNRVEDVTAYVQERSSHGLSADVEDSREREVLAEADVYARSREVRAALQAQAEASRRVAALANVAVAVSGAESVGEVTRLVVEQGLAALGAGGGAVAIRASGDRLRLTITESLGGQALATYAELPVSGPLPACVAAATGERVVLPDRTASLGFAPEMADIVAVTGCEAWVSLPLRSGRDTLGSLTVGWPEAHEFGSDEVELLDAFAAQCARGIERISARQAERAVAAATYRMAETLQLSLLTEPVQPDHLQVAVRYRPAADGAKVGGDWYDAFLTATDELSLVVGDVVGHDRQAAAAMGQLRNLLRGLAYRVGKPPARILTSLDGALSHFAVGALATMVLAQIEQTAADAAVGLRRVRWSSAGHPPPLLLQPDGTAELLHSRPDLLLGIDGRVARHDHEAVLPVGSTLLLYTDGLFERRGSDLDQDLERLRTTAETLADRDLETLCDELIDRMGYDGDDDVAVLAVRAHDESRPRPPEAGPERLR
jgi:PAS domain S-box-containing protein